MMMSTISSTRAAHLVLMNPLNVCHAFNFFYFYEKLYSAPCQHIIGFSEASLCYVSKLALIVWKEQTNKKKTENKLKKGIKNMVMFLNVGLLRSMSVFMYDSNFQTWKNICVVCWVQGREQLKGRKSATRQGSTE